MREGCFDRAPVTSWEDVARTVEEELGAHPDKLFAAFARAPIASGSLAQVHEAVLAVGEIVILLASLLPLVGISVGAERGCQQNDSLANG